MPGFLVALQNKRLQELNPPLFRPGGNTVPPSYVVDLVPERRECCTCTIVSMYKYKTVTYGYGLEDGLRVYCIDTSIMSMCCSSSSQDEQIEELESCLFPRFSSIEY